MNEIVDLVANIGFPIAVSIYLLVRVEIKLEGLTSSINNLAQTINSIK